MTENVTHSPAVQSARLQPKDVTLEPVLERLRFQVPASVRDKLSLTAVSFDVRQMSMSVSLQLDIKFKGTLHSKFTTL